ncbi:procollagen galactosyltransferase 1-like [Petromyzon marinus]|uniref:procollagen galactosyltransferase 1-like n=1 Tax=Petromyzon marinus TaxID=7757 RepID=UPI003F6F9A67
MAHPPLVGNRDRASALLRLHGGGGGGGGPWSRARFQHVLSLRQEALDTARSLGAEFVFLVDADVVLWNPATLGFLVGERRAVGGPMLTSRTAYSNYWSGITDKGYYRRTAEYLQQLRERRRRGCHRVPMLHSALLLHVGESDAGALAFHPPPPDYSWPYDDVIVFAHSCMRADLPGDPG